MPETCSCAKPDEQIHQLYELMQAIQNRHEGEESG